LLPNNERSRPKRGLINGLGHKVKVVSGNMDAYDEARINKELSFLRGNSELNTNFQNETLVRFEEINEHINREQVLISNFINSYQNKILKEIDEEYKNIQLIQYMYR